MRLALGRITVVVNQLLARLDADKLCPVAALILRAIEKPKLFYLRCIYLVNLVVIRNRVVVPPAPLRQLVAPVGADEDDASRRFALALLNAAPLALCLLRRH